MNRKKKLNSILKKKLKKANAKLAPKKNDKPRYISKAERAVMEEENTLTEIKND
ncbi:MULTISPECIES: DUF2986 domain-containing protein [unclassified Oleiphilus]|jgi:hypothetical protein|uniref:DUF2986 domain-containing protein n=1 Tax=unclassified Oleiphilus TaxID=2631174 RepID=UPI0009ECE96C|nr:MULTISPECIES: DUF2986 domain-containing protein [unclassified Oleiphilus]